MDATKNGSASDAELHVGETVLHMPIEKGTEGERAMDVSALLKNAASPRSTTATPTPARRSRPSPSSTARTASCATAAIPIEELAEQTTFLEVAYLLIYGELPTRDRARRVRRRASATTRCSTRTSGASSTRSRRTRTRWPSCRVAVAALCRPSTRTRGDPDDPAHVEISIDPRLIAKMPTIAAYAYKNSIGQPFVYPRQRARLRRELPAHDVRGAGRAVRGRSRVAHALELLLILHADHEQNCSTSTVRMVGSSRANLFASISAGIAALWGPLHGGANQEVLEMLAAHRAPTAATSRSA